MKHITKTQPSKIQGIVKEFPTLFDQAFSIDCGDGWAELVRLVCKYFQMNVDGKQEVKEIKFSQIKEKFGFLRVYFNISFHKDTKDTQNTYERMHMFIFAIENISGLVCETCGIMKTAKKNVQIRTPGSFWKKTMCDKCFEKAEKAYKKRMKD